MISCESFRNRFSSSTDDAEVLDHLRHCDACLDFAIETDPDVMFRALGGEMEPPGGVDVFVEDVMREVHLRTTEHGIRPRRRMGWLRELAVAATVAAAFTGATVVWKKSPYDLGPALNRPSIAAKLQTKPVVETYDSQNATIVEVPTEGEADDVKVVMIFDDSLPADL